MVKSMTGFGRAEYSDGKRSITAEIKSVNHRYSDITVKMPRRYAFAEEPLRAIVKKTAQRGRIDLCIQLAGEGAEDTAIYLNLELARSYYQKLQELKAFIGDIPGEADLRMLALMPEVLRTVPAAEDEEELLAALSEATKRALKSFDDMRSVEGERLAEDILGHNELIRAARDEIEAYTPQVKLMYIQKFRARIAELLGSDAQIPEERVLVEAAVFADKSDISEELVRLKSHCSQLEDIINGGGASGKKLDFLVQEMNREANTIGSKANDINITSKVLLLKAEIEKIREQVQNLE